MLTDKKQLRRRFRDIRSAIPPEKRRKDSISIIERLTELDVYKSATTVFAYVSFGTEVETMVLLDKIINDKKRLCVPLCEKQCNTMSAILLENLNALKVGAYGIPEPPKNGMMISKNEIDLVIVPALAFDKTGMRLGYGGGYYDRFLRDFMGASIGIEFSECITDKLPAEEFDCSVDMVIGSKED